MKHINFLYLLIASSALMLASIFSFSYRILGIGLLQWVIVIFLCFASVWKGKFRLADMAEYNYRVARESTKRKQFGKAIVYISAMPLMIVGVITVGTMLIVAIVLGGGT